VKTDDEEARERALARAQKVLRFVERAAPAKKDRDARIAWAIAKLGARDVCAYLKALGERERARAAEAASGPAG